MSKENALRRAAIAAHVAKVASQEKKKALKELEEYMAPGDTSKPMIDGLQVGTVSVSAPQPRYQVVDEKALVAWLEWNKPDAVHKVPAPGLLPPQHWMGSSSRPGRSPMVLRSSRVTPASRCASQHPRRKPSGSSSPLGTSASSRSSPEMHRKGGSQENRPLPGNKGARVRERWLPVCPLRQACR